MTDDNSTGKVAENPAQAKPQNQTSEGIALIALFETINSMTFVTKALEHFALTDAEQPALDLNERDLYEMDLPTTKGLCNILQGIQLAAEQDYARACAAQDEPFYTRHP